MIRCANLRRPTPRDAARARLAPSPLPLPDGFADAPPVLAMGGELKAAFCLLRDGQAILSHHMGDLENAKTFADYARSIDAYQRLFEHRAGDHRGRSASGLLSTKLGHNLAEQRRLPLAEVQHHHAHIAACLAENGVALDAAPVIGVALDGLGYGDDGTTLGRRVPAGRLPRLPSAWRRSSRSPCPAAPRRSASRGATHTRICMAEMGWARFAREYDEMPLHAFLRAKPRAVLDGMIAGGVNTPLASSCGRLFDAAAAAVGVCRERAEYEGQAAAEFEALVDADTLAHEDERLAYPFAIPRLKSSKLPYVEPLGMWQALLGDLIEATPVPVIAARFHKGLAAVIVRMVDQLRRRDDTPPVAAVALSGGVLQNRRAAGTADAAGWKRSACACSPTRRCRQRRRAGARSGGVAAARATEPPRERQTTREHAMCLGIPGRIVEITDIDDRLAIVDVGGVRRPINISFIAEDGRAPNPISANGCWCMSGSR